MKKIERKRSHYREFKTFGISGYTRTSSKDVVLVGNFEWSKTVMRR